MIFVVDDEQSCLELASVALAAETHEVQTFLTANEALAAAETVTPALIISDVMMPEMDGFEFHGAYEEKFAFRHTPFIFLSCVNEPVTVIKGLETGADDFLQKPILPEMLRAKVRSILRRSQHYISQSFSGDLEKLPFSKVMQFCEMKDLTGWVDLTSDDFSARFHFKGGELIVDDQDDDVDEAFALESGTFGIYLQPIDYQDIAAASMMDKPVVADESSSRDEDPQGKPMGRLSGVPAKDRLFQIQTEFSASEGLVVSVVILDGRVLHKKTQQPPVQADKKTLQELIEKQHLAVETMVHEKLESLTEKSDKKAPDSEKQFNELYEAGFEKYREGELSAALDYWQQAFEINPDNKTLQVNMSIIKKKIAANTD